MTLQSNWQLDTDYDFCEQLDLAEWAWQFLRREPAYQADYQEFISLWRQLETAYGSPPHRDFFKWKQDPRAWRSEADIVGCGTDICPGENEHVLIECWMGAKWGFRQFPVDPAMSRPERLAWREFPIEVALLQDEDGWNKPQSPEKLALIFDLTLPLSAQLDAAKRQLITHRQLRSKAGSLPPRNLREGLFTWRRALRILDALAAEATLSDITQTLALENPMQTIDAAIALRQGGYRRILILEPRSVA